MEGLNSTTAWSAEAVRRPDLGRASGDAADRHRNCPCRWNQRYALRLQLHVTGWRTSEIAAELRYSPHHVSMTVNSPLFQNRKAALLRRLERAAHADVLDEIRREAIPNLDFLCGLRDDGTLPARVRLRAAVAIADQLDRVLPRGGAFRGGTRSRTPDGRRGGSPASAARGERAAGYTARRSAKGAGFGNRQPSREG